MTSWFRSTRAGAVVATTLMACGLSAGSASCASPPATHKLAIEGMAFIPDVVTARVGDSIVWVNNDPFPHTVTSAPGGFDSKALPPGSSWTYVAAAAGDVDYVCTLHPTMKARLRIE